MDAVKVKSLREKLKAGKNYPVSVNINNNTRLIDESVPGQFTLWDDVNEIIYSISLPAMELNPASMDGITVFGVSYELIEGMQISELPLKELPNVLNSICVSDDVANAEHQQAIVNYFNYILDPDTTKSRAMSNYYTGANTDTADDYYNGKMRYSFKETTPSRANNEYVDSLRKQQEKDGE